MMLSTRLLGFTGVAATTLLNLLSPASAQLFVPLPQDITEVLSKNYPGASITYKENAICETTSGVRSWSGYVHLPSSLISDASYDQSLFFWYFGEFTTRNTSSGVMNSTRLTATRIETELDSCPYDHIYPRRTRYLILGWRQRVPLHCQP
jgi:hypothetical protein